MYRLKNNFKIIKTYEASLLDQKAQSMNNIPGIVLMEEASEKLFLSIIKDFKNFKNENIAIISGWGNNGGDSLSLARKLFFNNIKCDVYIFRDKKGSDLYNLQLNILSTLDIKIIDIDKLKDHIDDYTVIIDGIFGIGYKYRKDNYIENLFKIINISKAKILSIDTPSGIDIDQNYSITADYTYSIGFLKEYFYSINTRKKIGKIKNLKISFNINNIKTDNNVYYLNKIKKINLKKDNFVHKYTRGSCISIGGSKGQFGSIIFTAESALKTGCGISLVITEEDNVCYMNAMTKNIIFDSFNNIFNYIDKYNTIIIGPGLKVNDKNKKIIEKLTEFDKQFILDASFFSIFNKEILFNFKKTPILTPHPKEFKTFFIDESLNLNSNTIDVVQKISDKYNCIIILKESFLTISIPNKHIFIYDNPMRILAQAGSGDILTGIIGGLLSQDIEYEDAIIESIRIFYKIAGSFKKNNFLSYSQDKFIEKISYIN